MECSILKKRIKHLKNTIDLETLKIEGSSSKHFGNLRQVLRCEKMPSNLHICF